MTQNVSDPTGNPNASGSPGAGAPRHDLRDLRRSNDDRMIAGVCGGLGRYTGLDPIIFRIVLATLAIFGGVGLLLYALAWLLVPDEVSGTSEAERLRGGHRSPLAVLFAIGLGVVGLVVLVDVWQHHNNGQIALFIIVVVIAVIMFSRTAPGSRVVGSRQPGPSGPSGPSSPGGPTGGFFGPTPTTPPAAAYYEPGPTTTAPLGPPAGFAPSRPLYTPPQYTPPQYTPPQYTPPIYTQPAPRPPKPPRQPSLLAPLALSVGVLVTGTLFALDASHAIDITAQAVFAAALLTIGLALVIGTWIGRARTLIAVGAILAVALAVTAAIDVPLRGGIGTHNDTPLAISEVPTSYHLGIGNQTIDLTQLTTGGKTVHVAASVGIGQLRVFVPSDAVVKVHGRVGAGDLRLLGTDTNGTHVNRTVVVSPQGPTVASAGELDLDLKVGVGDVEVEQFATPGGVS